MVWEDGGSVVLVDALVLVSVDSADVESSEELLVLEELVVEVVPGERRVSWTALGTLTATGASVLPETNRRMPTW